MKIYNFIDVFQIAFHVSFKMYYSNNLYSIIVKGSDVTKIKLFMIARRHCVSQHGISLMSTLEMRLLLINLNLVIGLSRLGDWVIAQSHIYTI